MRNFVNFLKNLRHSAPAKKPKPSRFRTPDEQLEIDKETVENFDIDFERQRRQLL